MEANKNIPDSSNKLDQTQVENDSTSSFNANRTDDLRNESDNNYDPETDVDSGPVSLSEQEGENGGEDTKDAPRFKDGQVLKFVKVRFPGNARAFPFLVGKRTFQYGQKVVAMSDRGMMVGYINSFPYETSYRQEMGMVRSIARVASDEDLRQQMDFVSKEKEAERLCLDLIEKYKLDMVLTHVEYTQFGKKAVFFFTAPARVDFRDLVKDLVGYLKMRIELRQISFRDRSAAIGGIGVCGLQTCCSSFLSNYGNVSIKMAKNQNLALVPSKINGVCGQIKCCIKYEDDVYSEKRGRLPKENTLIQIKNGDFGKVLQLHVLAEQFEMMSDRGTIKRYSADLFDSTHAVPEGRKFPETFEFVTNETKTLVNMENCGNLLDKYKPKVELPTNEQSEDDFIDDDEMGPSDDDDFENAESKEVDTKTDSKNYEQKQKPVQTPTKPAQVQKNTMPHGSNNKDMKPMNEGHEKASQTASVNTPAQNQQQQDKRPQGNTGSHKNFKKFKKNKNRR